MAEVGMFPSRNQSVLISSLIINMIHVGANNAQKMKFSINDFFSKCDQIRKKLRIGIHLLKKCLMENAIFLRSVDFVLLGIFGVLSYKQSSMDFHPMMVWINYNFNDILYYFY